LYGWTAQQFDSATHASLFTAPLAGHFSSTSAQLAQLDPNSSATTVKIIAGVLVLTMMATTYLTSRQMILKTGWAEDPQQKMIQRLMLYGIPLSLLVSGSLFPIGVIIYWVTNNLFTLGQQQWVLRKYPPPQISGGKAAPPRPGNLAGSAGKGGSSGKGASKSAQSIRTGLFGRGKAAPTPSPESKKPAVDTKALAPRPGAKPVNPKKGRPANKPQG
jgi:YidC/Oxa1 family membrane protein insertase